MKKYILALGASLVVLGTAVAIMPQVRAESKFIANEDGTVMLAKGQTHTGSYYAAGQDIVIDGTVKGDLYCAGQTVRINGTVEGDVLCAAQTITMPGTVTQDVRVAGQFVTVSGSVGGTFTSFGQDVTLSKGATVGGDLNGAAQAFMIDGSVARDLAVGGDTVKIAGVINGSARIATDSLQLSSQPAIKGNLEYDGSNRQQFSDGSVGGDVKFNQATTNNSDDTASVLLNLFLFIAAAMMVTAIVVALAAPRYLERSFGLVRRKIGLVILSGVAVNFGLPIFALLLMVTGVGLPLGLVLFAALFVLNVLAFPFAAYYLSRALFGQVIHNIVLLIVAGAALLTIALAIPLLNILVYFGIITIGVGGLVVTMTNGYRKPQYSIEPPTTSRKK